MDRPVKRPGSQPSSLSASEWNALLRRIQSHSKEFEKEFAQTNANLVEALEQLAELETLTASGLATSAPSPELAGAKSPASTPTPTPTPMPETPRAAVKYQTTRSEYAPALDQNELVEALLQYQRAKALKPKVATSAPNAGPRNGAAASRNPGVPTTAAASADPLPPARSDFSPMSFPSIQAEPKAAPFVRSADSRGVRLPVLRLKPENGSKNGSGNPDDSAN